MPLENVLIIGDFNLHFDRPDETHVKQCIELFEVRNLSQHILKPTHKVGHIIDWVVTRNNFSVSKVNVFNNCISDHFFISFVLDFKKPKRPVKEIMSRDIRSISIDDFSFDLALSCSTLISLTDACKASVYSVVKK